MGRATLNLDADLLARACRLFATDFPSVAVNAALREVVRRADLEGFDAVHDVELDLEHGRLRA